MKQAPGESFVDRMEREMEAVRLRKLRLAFEAMRMSFERLESELDAVERDRVDKKKRGRAKRPRP